MATGLAEHSKKARRRMKAGVSPEAARAREKALREQVEARRRERGVERVDRRSRAEVVEEREKARVERRASEPRFKNNETVDRATAYRTAQRVERLGDLPKGIDASDGIQGAEARQVRGLERERKQYARQQRGLLAVPPKDNPRIVHDDPAPGTSTGRKPVDDRTVRQLAEKRVQRLHNSDRGRPVQDRRAAPWQVAPRPRRRAAQRRY